MPRLGSCRTISTNGSEVTTRNGRIKAAGVSASRRCKHSLTPSPLRGKKRSLPDHHQQRTGHLQKGTVCKIKYKLLQRSASQHVFVRLVIWQTPLSSSSAVRYRGHPHGGRAGSCAHRPWCSTSLVSSIYRSPALRRGTAAYVRHARCRWSAAD